MIYMIYMIYKSNFHHLQNNGELRLFQIKRIFNRTNSKELGEKTAVYVGPEPMAYAGYLIRGRRKESFAPQYFSAFLNFPWGKEKCKICVKVFWEWQILIPKSSNQSYCQFLPRMNKYISKLEYQCVSNPRKEAITS